MKDVVFKCRKCDHLLYVSDISIERIGKIIELECPCCGEEPDENWILYRLGNYEKEVNKYN